MEIVGTGRPGLTTCNHAQQAFTIFLSGIAPREPGDVINSRFIGEIPKLHALVTLAGEESEEECQQCSTSLAQALAQVAQRIMLLAIWLISTVRRRSASKGCAVGEVAHEPLQHYAQVPKRLRALG